MTGFVFLELKQRTVRRKMKVRAWSVCVSSMGVIAAVSVKGEKSVDELKRWTVKRKTKVRVWSSVGLFSVKKSLNSPVTRCKCACVWLSELG